MFDPGKERARLLAEAADKMGDPHADGYSGPTKDTRSHHELQMEATEADLVKFGILPEIAKYRPPVMLKNSRKRKRLLRELKACELRYDNIVDQLKELDSK